jgi:hypothetical protein
VPYWMSPAACARSIGRAVSGPLVCPNCVDASQIDKRDLLPNADVGGTVVMWQWMGDEGATTFSY